MARPGTVSDKHYFQIPTGISGLHYEWGFHGRPKDRVGVELHFESKEPSRNLARLEFLKSRETEWKESLSVDQQFTYLPTWGSVGWSKMYFERPAPDLTPELATQIARDMADFYLATAKFLAALGDL